MLRNRLRARVERDGKTYYFYAMACEDRFD
jgi:YHS domain-containing protein